MSLDYSEHSLLKRKGGVKRLCRDRPQGPALLFSFDLMHRRLKIDCQQQKGAHIYSKFVHIFNKVFNMYFNNCLFVNAMW